jgi:hypothetical protein
MPQLVKGGKYIFGWSKVDNNGVIRIPDEAYLEYEFNQDDKVILISGSNTSGGFGLSSKRLLKKTVLGKSLISYPELMDFQIPEGKVIKIKNKGFCWMNIKKNKSMYFPKPTLKEYSININEKLLVGRGSGLALAFISKGPIYEEAKKHSDIPHF